MGSVFDSLEYRRFTNIFLFLQQDIKNLQFALHLSSSLSHLIATLPYNQPF